MLAGREFELFDFGYGETFQSMAELPPPISQPGSVLVFLLPAWPLKAFAVSALGSNYLQLQQTAKASDLQHHSRSLFFLDLKFLGPLLNQGGEKKA